MKGLCGKREKNNKAIKRAQKVGFTPITYSSCISKFITSDITNEFYKVTTCKWLYIKKVKKKKERNKEGKKEKRQLA